MVSPELETAARRAQCASLGIAYVPPPARPMRPATPYEGRVEDVLIATPRPQPTEPVTGLTLWFGVSQLVALLIIAAAMVALHYASNP